jgi:putative ABC transport system permease protein
MLERLRKRWVDYRVLLREALRAAARSLISNKLRSALTVTGIIIGVGTVVGLISLVIGLNDYVISAFSIAGTDAFWVMRFSFLTASYEDYIEARDRPYISSEDAWAIRDQCPSVEYVAPRFVNVGKVTYKNYEADDVYIIGTTEEMQNIQGIKLVEGRRMTNLDVARNRNVVGLGATVRDVLFGEDECVGERIKVKGRTFTVVGAASPLGSFLGQDRDNMVIIPVTTFEKYFMDDEVKDTAIVMVRPKSSELQSKAQDEVINVMRKRHGLKANDENDFDVVPQSAFVEAYQSLTGVLFIVIIAVGGISLLVGGVGIMNIMLVSVTERTREIGLRKAVGARRRDIVVQFLLEAVILSVSGGAAGVAFGFVLAQLVGMITPLPVTVSPVAVVLGVSFATAVGVFFGLYPARKAARLDPIAALRAE